MKVLYECKHCGEPITDSEMFYRVGNDMFCADCVNVEVGEIKPALDEMFGGVMEQLENLTIRKGA